jgi:hypothetical protein
MKIEISYSEGKTIQEVQFEPRTFHLSAKVEIDTDVTSIENGYTRLKQIVKKALKQEIETIRGKDITKTDDIPWDYDSGELAGASVDERGNN